VPITVEWDTPEKNVILLTMEGLWTWEQLEDAVNRVTTLLGEVDHPVDTIFDGSRSGPIPTNAFTYLRRMNQAVHPNQAGVAIVGMNAFAQTLLNTFGKIYSLARASDLRFVSTLDEAQVYLTEQRTKRAQ
jgi:MFS superfamily sulfate permease-like transporter